MKKLLYLSLLLLTFFNGFSQGPESYLWKRDENLEVIIAAKNCYVRTEPSVNGKIVDSLQLGKKGLLLKITDQTLKLKGIEAQWVEISFNNNGISNSGYIWQGFLALDFKTIKDLTFLTSLEKIELKQEVEFTTKKHNISVKVLNPSNEILDSKEYKNNLSESYFFQDKCIGDLGLKNISEIYRISFSGEACGIPTYYLYYAWNNKNLIVLPEKYQVGDADVYYHIENFIFPKEAGGKPDQIIKVIEEAEEIEKKDSNGEFMMKISKWNESYSWNGLKAILTKKDKIKTTISSK
ncbi:hypothetical protein [Flavobacterium sp.]|uniref:hypothetical protein n=1 Tax=Flavobacterium sp. TaxID=239 RepID=UPI00286D9713|nr:hypothetical protein [Flavobacterium sp.]